MSTLNYMTGVIEEHPEMLEEIKGLVRAGADSDDHDPEERAHTLGREIIDLVLAGASGAAKPILQQCLESVDSEELGRWYIDCFSWMEWPMFMWADAGSVDDEGREQMREELLAVRDLYHYEFPDEEAVFAYLEDGENDLGVSSTVEGDDTEVSALDLAKLWKRRYQRDYESWSDRAEDWIEEYDGSGLLRYLRGVASNEQNTVLDELKDQFGRALAGDESGEYCYIDRLSTGGGILCLKRRDN